MRGKPLARSSASLRKNHLPPYFVRTRVLPAPDAPPDMAVLTVDLSTYDGLIGTQVEKVAS